MGRWPVRTTAERFWEKVRKTETCWLWTGAGNSNGYGVFRSGKMGTAHRFSWELHNGPIPEGLCVLHRCDVRRCINPEHLFLGTKGDNLKDMYAKGRAPIGEKHGMAKLASKDIPRFRDLYLNCDFTQDELGEESGISRAQAGRVARGQAWTHI